MKLLSFTFFKFIVLVIVEPSEPVTLLPTLFELAL